MDIRVACHPAIELDQNPFDGQTPDALLLRLRTSTQITPGFPKADADFATIDTDNLLVGRVVYA
jgi:hypothetical protein